MTRATEAEIAAAKIKLAGAAILGLVCTVILLVVPPV